MIAQRLAQFAAELTYEQIPEAVRTRARWHLLDAIGVCLASSSMAFGAQAFQAAARLGTGTEATAIGFGRSLPAASAALVNGTLLHGLEYDDTHTPSIIHGSSVVVPAALAAAEAAGATGRDLVVALVIGWEVLTRLGLAAPGAFQRRGFQTTAVCGPFAAALVSGRLMGLTPAQLTAALGIAGSQAGGNFEFLADGASVKQMHPGLASHAGLVASAFAAEGFRGPATVFEGRFGFFRIYADPSDCDLARVTTGLGEVWHTLEMSLKPYPCCHFNHAFLDCARTLLDQGLDPAQIAEITCLGPRGIIPVVCDPWPSKLRPRTGYDARFSLPYAVAAMFVNGDVGHGTFMDAAVEDPAVLRMAERVRFAVDEQSSYPQTFPGWVQVRTVDGDLLEAKLTANRGGPANPLKEGDIILKFMTNAALRLTEQNAQDLMLRIVGIADMPAVGTLWRELF